ncbi:MAG: putative porin, partial [Syntrophobacteraceae bacterium]
LRQKYGDSYASPYAIDALIALLKAKGVINGADAAGMRNMLSGTPAAPAPTIGKAPANPLPPAVPINGDAPAARPAATPPLPSPGGDAQTNYLAPAPPSEGDASATRRAVAPQPAAPPPIESAAPAARRAAAPPSSSKNAAPTTGRSTVPPSSFEGREPETRFAAAPLAPPPPSIEKVDQTARIVSKETFEEMKREMSREIRNEVAREIRDEIAREIKLELAQDVRREMTREVRNEVSQEIRKEMAQDVKIEMAREVKKDVKQEVKAELKEDLRRESIPIAWPDGTPDWVKRIRFGGDVRLRYQGEFFAKDNAILLKPPTGTELLNTRENRERGVLRVRLGAEMQVNDEVKAAVRITTGNDKNPVTTNEALEMTKKDDLVLDLAYLEYKPMKEMKITGGRVPNPYLYTDLVWDNDLTFTGLTASGEYPFTNYAKGFMNVGLFSLKEVELSTDDKWLYGVQAGVEIKPVGGVTAKLAGAYYGYNNIVGKRNTVDLPNEFDFTVPDFQQKGNTLMDIDPGVGIRTALASDFQEINITGTLDVEVKDPVHVTLFGDYVKNIGFNKAEVVQRTGNPDLQERTLGWMAGLAVGYPKIQRRFDWRTFFYYKHLEADAVVDAFTDSDFHLGGTNAKGWVFGAELGLMKNVWLTAKWLTADEIDGPPLAIDVLQMDINAKF